MLGQGTLRILTNENQTQSSRVNEVIMGDMILTQEQYEFMYGPPRTRLGNPTPIERWPNNIMPYQIDDSVDDIDDIALIKSTITKFNTQMKGCFSIV